jgi:hypothetical protein
MANKEILGKENEPTKVKELFGLDFQEPEGLSLTSAIMDIRFTKSEDGSQKFDCLIDYPLEGRRLLRILQHASPSLDEISTSPVVDEWALYDSEDSVDKTMARRHISVLGKPMEIFLKRRQKFMQTLTADREDVVKIVNSSGINLKESGFVEQCCGTAYDVNVISKGGEDVTIEVFSKGLHLLSVIDYSNKNNDSKLKILPDMLISHVSLRPAISWINDKEGQRHLAFDLEEDAIVGDHDNSFDNLLGILSLVYLFPEVKADWPKEQRLGSGTRTLPMGPIQIPVMVLQHEKDILKLPFFETAERHALKTST